MVVACSAKPLEHKYCANNNFSSTGKFSILPSNEKTTLEKNRLNRKARQAMYEGGEGAGGKGRRKGERG